jgi:CBS domain-containing protein
MLAKDIMTTDVITVGPEEPVGIVAKLLLDHRISKATTTPIARTTARPGTTGNSSTRTRKSLASCAD